MSKGFLFNFVLPANLFFPEIVKPPIKDVILKINLSFTAHVKAVGNCKVSNFLI